MSEARGLSHDHAALYCSGIDSSSFHDHRIFLGLDLGLYHGDDNLCRGLGLYHIHRDLSPYPCPCPYHGGDHDHDPDPGPYPYHGHTQDRNHDLDLYHDHLYFDHLYPDHLCLCSHAHKENSYKLQFKGLLNIKSWKTLYFKTDTVENAK